MAEHLDYTKHYSKWHSDSLEHVNEMQRFYRRILSKVLPPKGQANILDVGCGMGFALVTLKDMGYENTQGIDIDKGQVLSCLAKNLNVTHVQDTPKHLLALPNEFDIILALDVIEHISIDAQFDFIQSLFHALKPNGKLICTVPNANSAIAGRWRYIDWTHKTSFTESSISFLLENAGFECIEVFEVELFIKYDSPKTLFKEIINKLLLRSVRASRRIVLMAELGIDEGRKIPISVNLMTTALKPDTFKAT